MGDARSINDFVPGRPHWWQWLTILSLDAPLVAVAWQRALGRALRLPVAADRAVILAASVWLAYCADRWIEGWRLAPGQVQTQRHWFHLRWRIPVLVAWLAVLVGTVTLAAERMTSREFRAGLLLLGPVAAYLLSHQLVHRHHRWRAPKEICVALLLTGGVACFPLAARPDLLPAAALPLTWFALLCFANCVLIARWEAEVDLSHGQTSIALQYPPSQHLGRLLPWAIGLVAAAIAPWNAARGVAACASASGLLLGGIDLLHHRFGRQLSRVLADLALLTPFALPALAAWGLDR